MLHYTVIRKLVNGDENAFKEVYYYFNNYVYQLALRVLRNREKAEDVVAEVFVWLWEHRGNFENSSGLKAYLTICTRHRSFNIIRNEKRQIIMEYKVREALYIEDYVDPDKTFNILTKDKALELIYSIAERLENNLKIPFFLYYSDGESAVAIAEHLNITRQTVQYSVSTARKHIKSRIQRLPYKVIRENY